MQIATFAAIDIGSYEVEMKIFELSAKYGMREVDDIRYRIELGKDTYATGKISYTLVDELCEVLLDFTNIMREYKTAAYRACATSAIREAQNNIIILDQIRLRTGLSVEILSNSEQRFLGYKSIASKENEFNKIIQSGTAIVDVGGGSIQISLFDKDSLVTTQNIRMGNLRIREKLSGLEKNTIHFDRLVEELINSELISFKKLHLKDREIINIIVVGDYILDFTHGIEDEEHISSISKDVYFNTYREIINKNPEDIALRYGIPIENASLIIPSAIIYKRIIEEIGAKTIWTPGFNLSDGLAYDYAQKHGIIKAMHNFDDDILAAARNIAKRYMSNKGHIGALEELALLIFDSMKKIHGLGKRERLLLQIAVILHDCGKYISLSNVADCSYSIIMATEVIGLSHAEREIIANIVKFNTKDLTGYEDLDKSTGLNRKQYILIAKLAAILRVANGLDRSHKQKCKNVKIALKEKQLIITVDTQEDFTLERGLFPSKAYFFEEVFSICPIIRQKKHM